MHSRLDRELGPSSRPRAHRATTRHPSERASPIVSIPTRTNGGPNLDNESDLSIVYKIEFVEENAVPLCRVTEHLRVVHHLVVNPVIDVVAVEALLVRTCRSFGVAARIRRWLSPLPIQPGSRYPSREGTLAHLSGHFSDGISTGHHA